MSTPLSQFGPMVAASDVELALLTVLEAWLPDYLAELDRRYGDPVGTTPLPRGWVISAEVEKMPEDQTPAVVVASPGLTDPPLADGYGTYTARWRMNVAVVLSARGNGLALTLARRYALALRLCCLQQQLLSDALVVRRIDWADERYDVLDSIDDRTICVATVELAVEVAEVATRDHGPRAPGHLDPESPTWPTAESADVLVTKEQP